MGYYIVSRTSRKNLDLLPCAHFARGHSASLINRPLREYSCTRVRHKH